MEEFHFPSAKDAAEHLPDEITSADLSDFFKIFGDYTRIRLLFALKDQECCVHDLSLILGMQQSAVSHQLKTLRQYRIVSVRREGRQTFYALNDHHIFEILAVGLAHIQHKIDG